MMEFLSAWLFVGATVFLLVFTLYRFRMYRVAPENGVNFHYFFASALITVGLILSAAAGFLFGGPNGSAIGFSWGAIIATTFNIFGFIHLLFIPLYQWMKKERYVFFLHVGYAYAIFATLALVLLPPSPYTDMYGIIHWSNELLPAWMIAGLMIFGFSLNVLVLGQHFKRLQKLSLPTLLALIVNFFFAGAGGAYLYLGDNAFLLVGSGILLMIGLGSLFAVSTWGAIRAAEQNQH